MKRATFFGLLLLSFSHIVFAQFLDKGLSIDDLAALSPQSIEALKESEFEVFKASIQLAAAERLEQQAANRLKKSKNNLKSSKQAVKAIELEIKAAESNQEMNRIEQAKQELKIAIERFNKDKVHVNWKAQAHDAEETFVKKIDFELQKTKIKRDIARMQQLVSEKLPTAQNYSMLDFKRRLQKINEKIYKTNEKIDTQLREAKKTQSEYEAL